MESKDFKAFWESQNSPVHAHSDNYWYGRYAEEILSFLKGNKNIIDAGCGSGEIITRIAPHFDRILAIDYAPAMLELAKRKSNDKNLKSIKFVCDSIVNIGNHAAHPVDAIYSNGVIQYLSNDELRKFIQSSFNLLDKNGALLLFNIPNRNARLLFLLGFYKHEHFVPFSRVLKGLMGLGVKLVREKLKHGFKKIDDGIGNWYTIEQLKRIGVEHGFTVEIYGSAIVSYYYRFHAILRKND